MYAKCLLLLSLSVCAAWSAAAPTTQDAQTSDLLPAETSAKLLNLGGLFGQSSGYPNYGGYGQQYPNYGGQYGGYNNRPYYPSSGYYPSTGYYPNTGSGGYYPSTGGYYPNTGSYYPTTNILGNSGYGGYGGYGVRTTYG
ncbi:prisilkin-39 isoform X2 [Drosophila busckii]|uniref:prisilkin-39 isoform X2 n=1 Tax=Drosophila busckii TaxID=30019 RepID=UPI00083EA564|nr:prisilkin-39 isoform X2 [Drosophila busckii]